MIPAGAILCALAALTGGSAAAAGGGIPAVAVLEFEASNTSANDAAVVSSFVRSAIVRTLAFNVVDRNNMKKILGEQAFQQTGCAGDECAVRLGRILNVQRVVAGSYAVFEGVRVITAQIVDVETGRIMASDSQRFEALDNVDRAVDVLVDRLLADERRARLRAADAGDPAQPAARADPSKSGSLWVWLLTGLVMAGTLAGVVLATAR